MYSYKICVTKESYIDAILCTKYKHDAILFVHAKLYYDDDDIMKCLILIYIHVLFMCESCNTNRLSCNEI